MSRLTSLEGRRPEGRRPKQVKQRDANVVLPGEHLHGTILLVSLRARKLQMSVLLKYRAPMDSIAAVYPSCAMAPRRRGPTVL
jgi:hypothetical protein